MKKTTSGKKSKPVGRMPKTSIRVERTLRRHGSYPRRKTERAIVGDLAAYEWQVEVARRAVAAFLNLERGGKPSTFVKRLAYLKAAVDDLQSVTEYLQPELELLLKRKGGEMGEMLAAVRSLANTTAGFSPRSEEGSPD